MMHILERCLLPVKQESGVPESQKPQAIGRTNQQTPRNPTNRQNTSAKSAEFGCQLGRGGGGATDTQGCVLGRGDTVVLTLLFRAHYGLFPPSNTFSVVESSSEPER